MQFQWQFYQIPGEQLEWVAVVIGTCWGCWQILKVEVERGSQPNFLEP